MISQKGGQRPPETCKHGQDLGTDLCSNFENVSWHADFQSGFPKQFLKLMSTTKHQVSVQSKPQSNLWRTEKIKEHSLHGQISNHNDWVSWWLTKKTIVINKTETVTHSNSNNILVLKVSLTLHGFQEKRANGNVKSVWATWIKPVGEHILYIKVVGSPFGALNQSLPGKEDTLYNSKVLQKQVPLWFGGETGYTLPNAQLHSCHKFRSGFLSTKTTDRMVWGCGQ